MAGQPDTQQQAPAVPVESYQDIAFDGAFKGRVRALWAGAATGLVIGAATGLAAPIFPALTGAAISTAMVAKSVAIFSAVGMTSGFAVGATIGNASAGAAAVAEEQERRLRENMVGQAPAVGQSATTEESKPLKRLMQKLGDGKEHYFNTKVAATFAALGVVGGLVMAAAFFALTGTGGGASSWAMPAMETLLGKAASTTAVTAYFAGVMGCFGASMGFNIPKIITNLTHYSGDLLSGKALGTSYVPEKSAETAASQTVLPEPSQPQVTMRKYESYQELVAHQSAEPASFLAKR